MSVHQLRPPVTASRRAALILAAISIGLLGMALVFTALAVINPASVSTSVLEPARNPFGSFNNELLAMLLALLSIATGVVAFLIDRLDLFGRVHR